MERLQEGLQAQRRRRRSDADETLRLAEAVRVLALRHGAGGGAPLHRSMVESLRRLLDEAAGAGESACEPEPHARPRVGRLRGGVRAC